MTLGVVWALTISPKPLVSVGPQQIVRSINPKMGVHTRLTDEVEEWKIKRTLEMVREMGASWIVEYFPWAYVEPNRPGEGLWQHSDLVIRHAEAQGLKVVARLGFVPQWARPKESTPLYLDETHYEDFGNYVYEFVRRYRGQVDSVVIWNEPNLSLEWGFRPVDPASYTKMLEVAYRRAKEANPDVQVLAGALAPTLAPPGSEWGMDDLAYLQAMYDAGAAPYFDILAVHAYGGKFPPDEPAAADAINFARTELLHDVMVRNGDGHKAGHDHRGRLERSPALDACRATRPADRIHAARLPEGAGRLALGSRRGALGVSLSGANAHLSGLLHLCHARFSGQGSSTWRPKPMPPAVKVAGYGSVEHPMTGQRKRCQDDLAWSSSCVDPAALAVKWPAVVVIVVALLVATQLWRVIVPAARCVLGAYPSHRHVASGAWMPAFRPSRISTRPAGRWASTSTWRGRSPHAGACRCSSKALASTAWWTPCGPAGWMRPSRRCPSNHNSAKT